MLTRHSSVFQLIACNWKHLTNHKVQGKKVFWHVILQSYLCNALCKFSSKSKAINVFPKRVQSIHARKKLFCHVIVKNYLSNVSWKLLIKVESTLRCEIKEQAPQLTLLYHGRTIRRSRWREKKEGHMTTEVMDSCQK